jgi:biotin synthase
MYKELIDALFEQRTLAKESFVDLLKCSDREEKEYLFTLARKQTQQYYGRDIYIRGLIEFSNYCRNDCFYCGIRKSNRNVVRYRLSDEEILGCCAAGYDLGYRTFVLQSGEDPAYTVERIVSIVRSIKSVHPDCAVTLSVGEKSREEYEAYRAAGADRYLLRHETADREQYAKLKPPELSYENRMRCLRDLKDLGFQTGNGFMVGSPYQTAECLAEDLLFTKELEPEMIGIGPFIPHHDTPFRDFPAGSVDLTLLLIGILRLMFPYALIPATTALGTADSAGREKGVLAGANVIMPNLSPVRVRKNYMLYDNKICTGDEAAECRNCLSRRMAAIGYRVAVDRGDCKENTH